MPMYEYVCVKCGKDFEVKLSMAESDTSKPPCPSCGSRSAQRQLSTTSFSMGGGSGGGSDFESGGSSCSGGSCCCN